METRVLVVEDETSIGQMLCDILDEYGFETSHAENAESALSAMEKFRPAIALVDYRLGAVNGLELARDLKKTDPDLPVILMTAYPSLDLALKAIKEDIYDFLPKPVDRIFLARSIAKAVEKRFLADENKRLIEDLRKSNASLERASRMKTKFLSIVNHDLRTPITAARGFCDMLQNEPNLTEDDRKKFIAHVMKSINRMNDLVMGLLDIVSIEAGKLRIEKKRIDYLSVCRELEGALKVVADGKKIGLSWIFPDGAVEVDGDSNRLYQVLTNLVSNALKHTPEGGKVQVKISAADGKSRTEITDSGEGIAAEDIRNVFEQFYQVESSPHKKEGLGLGLAIAREIISAHGGEIGVQSEGLGRGSSFWFTLPTASST